MRLRTCLVVVDPGRLKGCAVLSQLLQVQVTEMLVRPIVVCLDLTTLLLSSKHDNDANVLLPDNTPEVL